MMRNSRTLLRDVLVVESPNKVKTISQLLRATKYSGTAIIPSVGHVCEMRTFDPISFDIKRELMDGKGAVLDKICREWDGKGTIYLALDPDREGEVMAQDLYTMLTANKGVDASALQRVSFNEVTGAAVTKALENPSQINEHMVHAGLARSVIDYWFGMAVSRHIQKGVKGARSAGRVQTPALGLVADRDAARQAFKAERFYIPRISVGKVSANVKLGKSARMTEEQAKMVEDHIKQHNEFKVSLNKSVSQGAPPQFLDTAGSLKEASKSLRVSTADVTKSLQRLFEQGLITYPRTDSTSLSKEGMDKVHKAIRGKFGDAYVLEVQEKGTVGKPNKGPKMTQEAHEAIRPTDMSVVRVAGSDQEQKLYEFLWRRTMEAAMPRPIFHVKTTTLTHPKKIGERKLSAAFETREMVFDGSNILRGGKSSSSDHSVKIEGPTCNVTVQKTVVSDTSPPKLLTEGDLIEDLKRKGIGRPSTYKSIIDKIGITRGYVNVNAKGNELAITQRGGEAIEFMRSQYPRWVDYGFTARLEKDLNQVANGKLSFKDVMSNFRRDLGVSLADSKVKVFHEVMETDPETGLNVYKKTKNYQLGEVGLTRVLPLDSKDLSLDAFLKHGKVHQSPTPWVKKSTKTAKSA
eukprot:TRINITY_DN2055_c1_g1_i1.p1 TRINITY_DN2055_c1_g1~~TRINITY_DN2055_c1_g1_i1.p1  ORF type:complete len:664 (+),score=220.06 TRINITY_DN2055_c1_g1_i1:93-1994(+)